jgi:hypothetical protein
MTTSPLTDTEPVDVGCPWPECDRPVNRFGCHWRFEDTVAHDLVVTKQELTRAQQSVERWRRRVAALMQGTDSVAVQEGE